MSKFSEFLNEEVKNIKENATESNLFIQVKLSEAIRIRAMFNEMTKSPENLAVDICDHYCKFPGEYEDKDLMIEEKCNDCPLGELVK